MLMGVQGSTEAGEVFLVNRRVRLPVGQGLGGSLILG